MHVKQWPERALQRRRIWGAVVHSLCLSVGDAMVVDAARFDDLSWGRLPNDSERYVNGLLCFPVYCIRITGRARLGGREVRGWRQASAMGQRIRGVGRGQRWEPAVGRPRRDGRLWGAVKVGGAGSREGIGH